MGDHDYFSGGDHDYVINIHDDHPPTTSNNSTNPKDGKRRAGLTVRAPKAVAMCVDVGKKLPAKPIKITDTIYKDFRGNYWKTVEEASSASIIRLKCIESHSVHNCLARATLKVGTRDFKELNKHNHQPFVRSATDIEFWKRAEIKAKLPANLVASPSSFKKIVPPKKGSKRLEASQPLHEFPNVASSRATVKTSSIANQSIVKNRSVRSLADPHNIHHLKELFHSRLYRDSIGRDFGPATVCTYQGEVTIGDGEMAGFWFGNVNFLSKIEPSMEIHTFGMDQLQLPTTYPVSHLFAIYFVYEEKCVTVLYALLQKTSQQVYTAVLQLFKDHLNFNLNGVSVLIGYNIELRKAAYTVFPFLLPKTCRFHYCLSVLQQLGDFKLEAVFDRYPAAFLLIKMLLALPFLPHRPREDLPDFVTLTNCWNAILIQARLQNLLTATTLKPIFDHFQNYWMKTIGPRMISMYDVSLRMNGIVENFNAQLLLLIQNSQPFWGFYDDVIQMDRTNVLAFLRNETPDIGHKALEEKLSQIFAAFKGSNVNLISLMEKLSTVHGGLMEKYLQAQFPFKEKYLLCPVQLVLVKDFATGKKTTDLKTTSTCVKSANKASNVLARKRPNTSDPKSTPPKKKLQDNASSSVSPSKYNWPEVTRLTPRDEVEINLMDGEEVSDDAEGPSTSSEKAKDKVAFQIDVSSDDDIEELFIRKESSETPIVSDVRSLCDLPEVIAYSPRDPLASVDDSSSAVDHESSLIESGDSMVRGVIAPHCGDISDFSSETKPYDIKEENSTPTVRMYCTRYQTYVYHDGEGYWFFGNNKKLQCVESKTSFRCKAVAVLSDDNLSAHIVSQSAHSHGPYKTVSNIVNTKEFLARLEEEFPYEIPADGCSRSPFSRRKSKRVQMDTEQTVVPSTRQINEPKEEFSRETFERSSFKVKFPEVDIRGQRIYRRRPIGKVDFKTFFEPDDLSVLKKIFLDPVSNQHLRVKGLGNVNFCQSFIRPKSGDLIGFWLCNKNFACEFVEKEKIDAVGFESLALPTYRRLPVRHVVVLYAISCKKITDLAYVFSLKPSYECFSAACDILKNHFNLKLFGMRMIIGFEKFAREAVSVAFPDAKMESCWSHFSRAVVEKISELGLVSAVKSNIDAMSIVRLLVALPLLPPDKIKGFGDLSLKNGWKYVNKQLSRRGLDNSLKPIMDYVRFEWINRLGPDKFSLFDRIVNVENEELELNDLVNDHRAELFVTCQEHDKFWELYDTLRDRERFFRQRYNTGVDTLSDVSHEETSIRQKGALIVAKALEDVKKGESSLAQFIGAVGTCCLLPVDGKEKKPDEEENETKKGFDIDNNSSDENKEDNKGEGPGKTGTRSVVIKRLEDFTLYYDGEGHYYHTAGTSARKRQLRCVEKRSKLSCSATATMFLDPPNAPIKLIKSHNHPPHIKHHIHTVPFLEALKKRYVRNEKNFKKHFDEELENFPAAKGLVTYNCIRQQVIRCARKAAAPKPAGLGDLAWVLQNPLNRLKWSNALQTDHALFQGVLKHSDEKISGLWFSHLEFAHALLTDYDIYFEAVYFTEVKIADVSGVEQLITVYFVVNGKSIPVLNAILADILEETYVLLMRALFSHFRLEGKPIYLPPHPIMLQAIKRVASSARITPSWFYYIQAVLKKLVDLNFKLKIHHQTKNSIVRMFLALALLPASPQEGFAEVTVEKGLQLIKAEVEKYSLGASLEAFVQYYDEFWMNEITPGVFSCFKTPQYNEFIEDSYLKTALHSKLVSTIWKIYTKIRSSELRIRKQFLREIKVPSTNNLRKGSAWARNDSLIEEIYAKFQRGDASLGEMLECLGTCHIGILESFLQGRTDLKITGLPVNAVGSNESNQASLDDNEENHESDDDLSVLEATTVPYDPEQLMKDSLQNPIPSSKIFHRNNEFTVYDDGRGFFYRCCRKSDKKMYYRCVESSRSPHFCRATAYSEMGPADSPIVMLRPHSHSPHLRQFTSECREFIEKVVERAKTSGEPVRRIYEDELKKTPHLRMSVSYQMVRRSLYQYRRCGFPPVPPNLPAFEQLVLNPKHSKFALVRDGIAVFVQGRISASDGEVIGIWMANKEFVLSLSRKCKLEAAGVFVVQPKVTVFRHLIIVYVYINGLCVPVLYVTSTIDSEECFVKTMEIARDDLNLNFNHITVMVGFNSMLSNAVRQIFPQALVSSSWFHFIQSVLRQVDDLGHAKTLTDKPQLFCLLRLLIALPLLPPDEGKNMSLIKGWEAILTFTDANNLFALAKPILVKFRTHWIDAVGTQAFSVFGSKLKVSSVIEDLHLKTEECLKNRMPFWTLYEKIRQIEMNFREDFTTRQKKDFSEPPPNEAYWPLMEELDAMVVQDNWQVIDALKKIACWDIRFLQSVVESMPRNYLQFLHNYSIPDETNKDRQTLEESEELPPILNSKRKSANKYIYVVAIYMTVLPDHEERMEVYSDVEDNNFAYEISNHPTPSVALRGRNDSTVYYDGRGHYFHLHHKGQKNFSMRCVENKTKYRCKAKGYMDRLVPNSPIFLWPKHYHTHVPFIRDYIDKFPTVENVRQYEMGETSQHDDDPAEVVTDVQTAEAAMIISNIEFD